MSGSFYYNFARTFGNQLAAQLRTYGGDITKVPTIEMDSIRPIFNGTYNKFHGLQILVNDTEYTKIEMDDNDFQLNPTTGNWSTAVTITINDHFGLDKADALEYQTYSLGFSSWWLLQHTRGYKPLNTVITVKLAIYGHL